MVTFRAYLAIIFFALSTSSFAQIEFEAIPSFDASTQLLNGSLPLSGKWGFIWDQWIAPDSLIQNNPDFDTVTLPNYLFAIVPQEASTDAITQGIASYFIRIQHLDRAFRTPSIHMNVVREAWKAYWLSSNGDVQFLGESGKISRNADNEIVADKTALLNLPTGESDGVLIIHLSSHYFDRSGVYGRLSVVEQADALRGILADLASRTFIVGLGIYIVIQNLVFYVKRRKETTLLLLAIFAFIGMARTSLASGYVDYFVTAPAFTFISLKLEYLMVIWPGVAGLQYINHLFPTPYAKRLNRFAYTILGVAALYLSLAPISDVTYHLPFFQISLLIITGLCLVVIFNGLHRRMPDAGYFLMSFSPLLLAVVNDMISARSAGYQFYVAEYALFLFLFLQTQIQASRFVTALDTAEHLSKNLQREVADKTRELSERNAQLVDKANHLEEKHHEIKLLSEIDHLTGLFNRQTLESRSEYLFNMAKSYSQPLSVVMMDLDHFKRINDQHGHLVGDECLVFVASFLRGFNLRKRDIIARYGGEEMTIILTDTPLLAAKDIVQSICDGLKQLPIEGDHPDIYLSASFGIADIDGSGADTVLQLIQCADKALYWAKEKGRNRVELFDSQLLSEQRSIPTN